MKARPILFSAPMVRAILAGTKTQTRRVVKPQPVANHRGKFSFSTFTDDEGIEAYWQNNPLWGPVRCPYGRPGQGLWVRETFALENTRDYEGDAGIDEPEGPVKWVEGGAYRLIPRYRATAPHTELMIAPTEADEIGMRWTPSIHMPRWASRITLEITDVRIERLQEISAGDALAEGINPHSVFPWMPDEIISTDPDVSRYAVLWESINGAGSWAANPWVWVVEFRRGAA